MKVTRVNKLSFEVITFNTIILAAADANISRVTMSKKLNVDKSYQDRLYRYAPENLKKK